MIPRLLSTLIIVLLTSLMTFCKCQENNIGRNCFIFEEGWHFCIDSLNQGEVQNWPVNFPMADACKVRVPHTWNVMKGLEDYTGTGWYQRSFRCKIKQNRKFYLLFEAVYRDATIFFNGKEIYRNTFSGYLPFKLDVTEYIQDGINSLVLKVSNRYTSSSLPYGRSFDWANDGGIIRPVSLIQTQGNLIDYIYLNPANSGAVEINAVFFEEVKCDCSLHLFVSDRKNNIVFQKTYPISAQTKEWQGHFFIEHPQLWHFDHPYLYKVTLSLSSSDICIDNLQTQFGFREIELVKDQLFLNGESVRVCGIEWMPGSNPRYGMAEPKAYIDSVLADLKDIHCVLTRFHWPQSDYVLSKMDEMGFLVQEEIPWWQQPNRNKYTDTIFQVHKKQIERMIQSHYNHPSIIAWGLGNEVWGQDQQVKHTFRQLKEYADKLDENRLITYISNSIFRNPAQDIAEAGDILTWNEYIGTWHGKSRDELPAYLENIHSFLPHKPMFITEHGLCEPVFKGGEERRIDDMIYHFNEWKKHPWIVGTIYFSLNDYRTQMGESGSGRYRQRIHGLCDLYRNRKKSFEVYQKLSSPIQIWEEKDKNGKMVICLQCKNTLPSYTVKGYLLKICYPSNEVQEMEIPTLRPGEAKKIYLGRNPLSYSIVRPQIYDE